jgi:putative lipoic acid-binding regulatory protein
MMSARTATTRVRLVFADKGNFHAETVLVSAERLEGYERLLDFLREDEEVTRQLYVDLKRLVSAYVLDDED